MSDNNSDSGIETSRFATFFDKNGWWYAAAALMLLVGLGLIVIILLPSPESGNGTTPTTAPTDTAPPPLSSPANPSGSASAGTGWSDLGCNGTKGSSEPPLLAPDVSWEPVSTLSVPTSTTYGPRKVEGHVRSCYQHSPTGAVLAAVNVLAVGWTVPSSDRAATLTAMMTPGSGRDASISGGTSADPGTKFVAFSVESCSSERCNVSLAYTLGTAVGVGNFSMVWSDGDWLLDGTQEPTGNAVEAVPAGFKNWKD